MSRGAFLFLLSVATPALAAPGIPVPEPDALGLFVLGVAGVLIGRRASRRRAETPEPFDDGDA